MVLYAVVLFLASSIPFSEGREGYDGYKDWFYSRRVWLVGLLCLSRVTDVADSLAERNFKLRFPHHRYQAF